MSLDSPGAPQHVVDTFKDMAGDGDIDERCARIMGTMRNIWGMPEPQRARCKYCNDVLTTRIGKRKYCDGGCRLAAKRSA